MTETKPMGRQALKRLTKQTIENAYLEAGCFTETKSAGAVDYIAVRLSEQDNLTIANIYGSRTGAASIWVKEWTWDNIRANVGKDDRTVIDVQSYKRGMDWSIEVHDQNDPIIGQLVETTIQHGHADRKERAEKAEAKKQALAEATARAEAMAAKRRDPFA